MIRAALLVLLLVPAFGLAYEGGVRREEGDAGVHVPTLTRPPELLEFAEATYPPEAQAAGTEASVVLAVTIAADGTVADARVTTPVGSGFDEAALEAVRRFRFSPAEVDGVPSPVQIEYVYNFRLQPKPAVAAQDAGVPAATATATLRGRLVARGSRDRVAGGTVRCGDGAAATEALSDEEGRFTLEVPAGRCDVKVVASNFHLYETTEDLGPGEALEVVYHLLPRTIGYESVVRGKREKKEVVRRTLERQELQKTPGTFGDPIRVIQNLPGLARAPFFSGLLIVRGAAPQETRTFIDGVEVPLLFHLGGGPSVVNAEFLEKLDFYPGGFGARYGRAIGGIVDVETRKGASDTLHGSVKLDLLDTGLFLEAPVASNVSVAGAARRSYIDGLLPLVLSDDNLTVQPVYWDYQLRVDVGAKRPRPGSAEPVGAGAGTSSFYVMAFGADDTLKLVSAGDDTERGLDLGVHTLFHRLKGDWTWRKGNVQNILTPFLGYDFFNFDIGALQFDADSYNGGLREDFRAELSSWLTFRAGADFLFEHLSATAELPVLSGVQYPGFPGAEPEVETQRLTRTFNTVDLALYTEVDLKAGRFTFTPGLRGHLARITHQTRSALEPRLWVRYALRERTALKGSLGLYTQLPRPGVFDGPPFGNPAIGHERAFQTSLGVEHQLRDDLSIDLTGYFNRRYDLVVGSDRVSVADDGSVVRENFANDGVGRSYGLEAQLKHDVTRNFFGWISYTFNRSEARGQDESTYKVTEFDQTHILTAVGSYRLGKGWELGSRFRLVTGSPRTPLQHRFDQYDADTDGFFGAYGAPFSARERTFHQLDLRVEKSWVFTSWTLAAYVDIQNLYNAKNSEFTLNDYRFRKEIQVPGIPFLPVIGLKGSF